MVDDLARWPGSWKKELEDQRQRCLGKKCGQSFLMGQKCKAVTAPGASTLNSSNKAGNMTFAVDSRLSLYQTLSLPDGPMHKITTAAQTGTTMGSETQTCVLHG